MACTTSIGWTLLVEQVIFETVVPGIEKWLPTAAAITLTNAPGAGGHLLSVSVAGLLLDRPV